MPLGSAVLFTVVIIYTIDRMAQTDDKLMDKKLYS
jgi:hypothetical protein